MKLLRTIDELRAYREGLKGVVALVPTMGALHEGHVAHLGAARVVAAADHTVVSVFVNPTQFAPNEDLDRYPRTLGDDLERCEQGGAAAVFAPTPSAIYPPDTPACPVGPPPVGDDLEGARRPTHFAGVCRVVLKLLQLVQPQVVTFGRKDYQQLCVIRAMIDDLFVPTRIVEVPTVRESDGLAMSSRNRNLDPNARQRALALSKALRVAAHAVSQGETNPAVVEAAMTDTLAAHHLETDYAVVRHFRNLAPLDTLDPSQSVALIAARVTNADGSAVRLIDNLALDEDAPKG
ncbi:MAG: pantoate--beta-alanine ligase [Algisphaera sp.]